MGIGYRGRDRRPSCRFKFAVSETRFPSRDLRVTVSKSRPGSSRLRGMVLRTVGFRRRSPAPPWPARLRGSAECSAACRVVPVPLFLDRIPPGLSAGVGTGGRQQSRENQKERARRGVPPISPVSWFGMCMTLMGGRRLILAHSHCQRQWRHPHRHRRH